MYRFLAELTLPEIACAVYNKERELLDNDSVGSWKRWVIFMSTKTSNIPTLSKEGPIDLMFLSLAAMYEQMGQIDSALSIYNSILKRNGKSVGALCGRAIIWLLKSQDDKAYNDVHKAATLAPRDLNALRLQAFVRIVTGNYEAALKDLKKALEANEWDSITCLFAFLAMNKWGDAAESAQLLNDAVDLRIKSKEWPFPILQYWRGDISITDLMAMANSSKARMLECRAYLGFSKVLSNNEQEGKPDLQFVYNAQSGAPLTRAIAARGLKMLTAGKAEHIASQHEKADRNLSIDWMD